MAPYTRGVVLEKKCLLPTMLSLTSLFAPSCRLLVNAESLLKPKKGRSSASADADQSKVRADAEVALRSLK